MEFLNCENCPKVDKCLIKASEGYFQEHHHELEDLADRGSEGLKEICGVFLSTQPLSQAAAIALAMGLLSASLRLGYYLHVSRTETPAVFREFEKGS